MTPSGTRGLVRRRRFRRRRIAAIVALLLVAATSGVAVDYALYMTRPSSVPWKLRSVEYLRDRHFAWAVNDVENWWYGRHAPKKGGPGPTALPMLGTAPSPGARRTPPAAAYQPPRVKSAVPMALKGEGRWSPIGRTVAGSTPLLGTTFRSEADYPGIVTYAIWIDTTQTTLSLYAGRYEPPKASPRGPMMIPVDRRAQALAAFNSGFKQSDGGGGAIIDGRVSAPMVPGRGTVVAYRDGHVDVISWRAGMPVTDIVSARQNLPLIVDGGQPNPALTSTQHWGFTLHNAVRVWRTALGVDARGNLIYVAADHQTAPSIAAALARAGAVRGIELDINSEWPTFNVFGRPGCGNPSKIIPNPQQSATRYLVPDDRDFFAVFAR